MKWAERESFDRTLRLSKLPVMLQHRADHHVSDIRLSGAIADVGADVCSSDESIRKIDQVIFWPHSQRTQKI